MKLIGMHDGYGDARCSKHVDSDRLSLPVYDTMELNCTYCGQDWAEPEEPTPPPAPETEEFDLLRFLLGPVEIAVMFCHCGGEVLPSTDADMGLSPQEWVCSKCRLVYA